MKMIPAPPQPARHPQRAGFSLVEVTLALGVAAFCLVAVFGLLPVGLSSNQTAITQTTAASVAAQIAADLHATPPSAGTSALGFKIPAAGGGASTNPQVLYFTATGQKSGAVDANTTSPILTGSAAAYYRANVGFAPPSSTGKRNATMVRILVTWPAAGPQAAGWPTSFVGSFASVTALDRN